MCVCVCVCVSVSCVCVCVCVCVCMCVCGVQPRAHRSPGTAERDAVLQTERWALHSHPQTAAQVYVNYACVCMLVLVCVCL